MKLISIVLPVYNEEKSLPALYERLVTMASGLPQYAMEFIFVDDGGTDGSASLIRELRAGDRRVKLLSFSRNFGHQIALTGGIDHAGGNCVIVMDADLQHPPEVIPQLIEKWEEGYEIVNTIRKNSRGATFLKKASAAIFYWLMNKMTCLRLERNCADFRLMDKKAVDGFRSIREKSRFLRGLVNWIGYRQTSLEYEANSRVAGESRYSLPKMLLLALDGITAFSAFPLRLATYLGFTISFFSFVYACYSIYAHLFTPKTVPGWTSIFVAVIFIGGCQLICIGLLGEYVSRIFDEVKGRPLYIIKEKLGIDEDHPCSTAQALLTEGRTTLSCLS